MTKKEDGPFEEYWDNGQLKTKETYKDGKRIGLHEIYYENGQLRQKSIYKEGKMDGPYEAYYESGQLKAKSTGKLDGPLERKWNYYENGQLEWSVVFKGGLHHGPYEKYYDTGQLETKCAYKGGSPDGPYEAYYRNGHLFSKGTYKIGKKCGEWLEDGKIKTYEGYTPPEADPPRPSRRDYTPPKKTPVRVEESIPAGGDDFMTQVMTVIFSIYFVGWMIASLYEEWMFFVEEGFLVWLLFGWIVHRHGGQVYARRTHSGASGQRCRHAGSVS